MTVSVVIVTIGAKDYIKVCLKSLFAQSCPPCEIIVIDNSLKPGLAQKINKLHPSVKIYPNSKNLFYGVSLNKGIGLSKGEFALCLNDDVVLDKEFIREALKGFLIKDTVGMVSGKILRRDGKTLDSAGLFLSIWRTAKERGYGKPDLRQFEKSGYIFGASGAVAFYRRQMLEEIKSAGTYFDPKFKMFYEDLDLCWRANRSNWQGYYISSAIAYHARGGSFRPDPGIDKPIARRYLNDELHYELIKNRYLAILKNETFLGFLLHFIPIITYDFCAWAYILFFRPKVIKRFLAKTKVML